MNLHEYQAKKLFSEFGINVPNGQVVQSADEAVNAAQALGGNGWVVKAQVHAGGRGKGGGVKRVAGASELQSAATDMLGSNLITHQTGPEGLPINSLLVEELSSIDKELYLSAVVDRGSRRVVFMASPMGGMDIEEVAANQPEDLATNIYFRFNERNTDTRCPHSQPEKY